MRVHPEIAAMRSDRAPQRHAQAAMKQAFEEWRGGAEVAGVLDQFERFGNGAALEDCPALEAIFTGQGQAEALAQALAGHFCRAMARHPLGHPPFRNGSDGKASSMLLARSGRAQLMLQSREPGRYEYPCVTYSDALRFDAVVAGRADASILRIHGPDRQVAITTEGISLRGGVRLAFDSAAETLLVEAVGQRLVTLRLLRSGERPRPMREYCRASGRLLHRSAPTLATSRREMMVALLGRMERPEAAPVLARMACEEADDSLRWQALREALALDTATGFAALGRIARKADDPLAAAAGALRASLLETLPQLRQLEDA